LFRTYSIHYYSLKHVASVIYGITNEVSFDGLKT